MRQEQAEHPLVYRASVYSHCSPPPSLLSSLSLPPSLNLSLRLCLVNSITSTAASRLCMCVRVCLCLSVFFNRQAKKRRVKNQISHCLLSSYRPSGPELVSSTPFPPPRLDAALTSKSFTQTTKQYINCNKRGKNCQPCVCTISLMTLLWDCVYTRTCFAERGGGNHFSVLDRRDAPISLDLLLQLLSVHCSTSNVLNDL